MRILLIMTISCKERIQIPSVIWKWMSPIFPIHAFQCGFNRNWNPNFLFFPEGGLPNTSHGACAVVVGATKPDCSYEMSCISRNGEYINLKESNVIDCAFLRTLMYHFS